MYVSACIFIHIHAQKRNFRQRRCLLLHIASHSDASPASRRGAATANPHPRRQPRPHPSRQHLRTSCPHPRRQPRWCPSLLRPHPPRQHLRTPFRPVRAKPCWRPCDLSGLVHLAPTQLHRAHSQRPRTRREPLQMRTCVHGRRRNFTGSTHRDTVAAIFPALPICVLRDPLREVQQSPRQRWHGTVHRRQ